MGEYVRKEGFGKVQRVLISLAFGEPDFVDVGVIILGDEVVELLDTIFIADKVDFDILAGVGSRERDYATCFGDL